MGDRIEPSDAERALSEIDRRREQVIRRPAIPAWYWWTTGALIVVFTASVEYRGGRFWWIGGALFVVVSLVINVPVSRAIRAAPVHRSVASRPGSARRVLMGFAAIVAALLGVVVGTALSLRAAGVPYPGTIASTVAAVLFAVGGQMLVRYEAAVLVRRSRSRG